MSSELHHLAAAYALDALEPDERQAFEAHYPTCEVCSAEVIDYREVAAGLAAAEETAVPDDLRAKVLAEVSQTRQLSPRASTGAIDLAGHRFTRSRLLVGAAAAAVLLIAGVFVFRDGSSGGTESELINLLASPDLGVQPLEGDSSGSLTIAWSSQAGSVAALGSGLADPGGGRAYALWLLDDAGASPSLLFTPDDDGLVEAVGELERDPTGWGVTIEPESGSSQPTGEILFLGSV